MSNDDIVVGGIYEFDYDQYVKNELDYRDGYIEKVIIIADDNHPHGWAGTGKVWVGYEIQVYRIKPEHLLRQIGYDATYSDAYQHWRKLKDAAQKALSACHTLLEFTKTQMNTEHQNTFKNLQCLIEVKIKTYQKHMDAIIQEQSWMKEDSHEQR